MSKEQEAMRQRIKILVDEFENGVQRRFAVTVGVHATTIGEILGKRQNQPSSDLLQKIALAYPQLRTEWLLLGEGEMLKPDAESQNILSYGQAVGEGTAPPGAGENSISPHLRRAGYSGDYAAPPRTAEPETLYRRNLPGLDLLELVAQQGEAIEQLQQQVAQLQAQATPTKKK